jgi:hypothetical protein
LALQSVKLIDWQRAQLARQMRKKVAKINDRAFVFRLGYNNSTAAYTGSNEIARLSGSSLNRQYAKKKKMERERENEALPQITGKVGANVNEFYQYRNDIKLLREDIAIQQAYKGLLSPGMDRSKRLQSGFSSKRTKGKVRDKCTAFYRVLGEQKTFLTLTFIQSVEHKEAVKILNTFLTQLRKMSAKKLHYVWVAELQMENKKNKYNIHFHMIINRKFSIKKINALWVLEQYNAGLRFRDYSPEEILQRYQNSLRSTQAKKEDNGIEAILNPVDFEKINGIYGLNYYLTKYITKKNKPKQILCAKWHCSRSVSRLFTKTIVNRSTFSESGCDNRNSHFNRKSKTVTRPVLYQGKFHLMYYINNREYFSGFMSELEQANKWMIEDDFLPDKIPEATSDELRKFFYDNCSN